MSQELRMKRSAKDTVFRDLFSRPEYLLQLYQALHPEDTDITEQDLKIVTLQNILANGIYNDLGFLAKDKLLILVEAQSTWSPNIIIRSLIYLMSTYQEYFNENNVFLYGTRTIKMPKPELFVVYTQEKGSHPDVISFRDTFFPNESCCIEAKANVIYANDSDTIINQYIHFCTVLNQQVNQGKKGKVGRYGIDGTVACSESGGAVSADTQEALVLTFGIKSGDGVTGPAGIVRSFSVLFQDAGTFSAILGSFWNDCSDCFFVGEFTCQICFFHH